MSTRAVPVPVSRPLGEAAQRLIDNIKQWEGDDFLTVICRSEPEKCLQPLWEIAQ